MPLGRDPPGTLLADFDGREPYASHINTRKYVGLNSKRLSGHMGQYQPA